MVTTPNVLAESILVVGSPGTKWFKIFTNWNVSVAPIRSVALKSLEIVASRFQNPKPRSEPAPPEFVSWPRIGRRNSL